MKARIPVLVGGAILIAALWPIMGAAGPAGYADAPEAAFGHGAGERAFDRGRYPPRAGDGYYPPEIQVFMDAGSEHWPSNYLPDSHSLDGYDGVPDRPTVCAGASGRSWSTRERECPPGQESATPARSWSTRP